MGLAQRLALLLCACAAGASAASAQAPAPIPLPTDPAALMQLACASEGLHGADLKPWHVRASWTELDSKGNATGSGTLEEWWAAPAKYRVMYTAGSFQQTIFVTDHGAFVSGSTDDPNWNFALVQQSIVDPGPDADQIREASWRIERRKDDRVELICAANSHAEEYCFANDRPVIRVAEIPGKALTANALSIFQGRYLANRTHIFQEELPKVDISIDAVESVTPVDSDFTPPPDAQPAKYLLLDGENAPVRISGDPPQYPAEAKAERISGAVWVDGIIHSNGTISDLRAVSGPALLRESALAALKAWRYKPFLVAGQHFDVRTRICVSYRLVS